MYKLEETSVEWALLHLMKFSDSDFFPKLFEFEAIKHDWANVREYLLSLDIDSYVPKTPDVCLSQKPNGTFRIVHQLDPLDSLILTALVHEVAEIIENFRIPEERSIACSYRIRPDTNGSFIFNNTNGFPDFLNRSEALVAEYEDGYVLKCDLVDFYNQIYLHRVRNLLSEAGATNGYTLERFLTGLNTNISQGVPVGPFASILLAELVMADIDKKILSLTDAYTRYVDDMHMFFRTREEASIVLHKLTEYLYSNHRLVISSEKTKILSSEEFRVNHLRNEERNETERLHRLLDDLKTGFYSTVEDDVEFADLETPEQLELRIEAYTSHFAEVLEFDPIELSTMRHILRQAGRYRIRALVPLYLRILIVCGPC